MYVCAYVLMGEVCMYVCAYVLTGRGVYVCAYVFTGRGERCVSVNGRGVYICAYVYRERCVCDICIWEVCGAKAQGEERCVYVIGTDIWCVCLCVSVVFAQLLLLLC